MTDRELLEKAAKAAGYEINAPIQAKRYSTGGCDGLWITNVSTCWNPLTDDGDALRLAVKLRMDVVHFSDSVRANVDGYDDYHAANDGDPYAATRRAIVRAASAMEANDDR